MFHDVARYLQIACAVGGACMLVPLSWWTDMSAVFAVKRKENDKVAVVSRRSEPSPPGENDESD